MTIFNQNSSEKENSVELPDYTLQNSNFKKNEVTI